MKRQDNRNATWWLVLLSLVAIGTYSFILSLIGGIIVWVCIMLGQSYDTGIAFVLAFLVLELALFFSAKRSPAAKATSVLLHPIIVVARRIVSAWPCPLSKNIERDIIRQLIRGTSKLVDPL